MSYKKRKLKRSKLREIVFWFRIMWNKFFSNFKQAPKRKGEAMRFLSTSKVMEYLRKRNRFIGRNNLKINSRVDAYLDACMAEGKPVVLLTQWCVSRELEARIIRQGGVFVPTRKERRLFEADIPEIGRAFRQNGFNPEWWITFNRSYLDSGQVEKEIERLYKEMIGKLAEPVADEGWLMLADWEDEFLGFKPGPDPEIFANTEKFVSEKALRLDTEQLKEWTIEELGLRYGDEEIRRLAKFKIACEAEEGRFLLSTNSPLREFVLVPLEAAERYDRFSLLAPDFKERIVSVLPLYPWRLKEK